MKETLEVYEAGDGYAEVHQAFEYLGATITAELMSDTKGEKSSTARRRIVSECPGLTDEQMKKTNGCGSSAWFAFIFRLPKWLVGQRIHCACNRHDLAYQDTALTSYFHKQIADSQLYNAIVDDAMGSVWIVRQFKLVVAEIVYRALKSRISWWCWTAAKK